MHEKSEPSAFKQTHTHLHLFHDGGLGCGLFFFYLLSSKPFKDTISAFSSPTVWLSRMRLVEDDAYRKATSETNTEQLLHTHTCTVQVTCMVTAQSQYMPFNNSSMLSSTI